MSTILGPAREFFEACETGQGWDACKAFCDPDATFSSQTGALSEISTLEGYCEWMQNLLTPIPDGHYELKFFAVFLFRVQRQKSLAPSSTASMAA